MTHIEHRQARPGKEAIHSGHFMVSQFEAEAQDDFDDLAVPVPDEEQHTQKVTVVATYTVPGAPVPYTSNRIESPQHQQLSIETSLTKLFKCMTLAYRQKLTSPKWNRFKGIKLRWKEKIRLNNVIWRCWHMQFIKKQNTLVCQFASPLDVDTHVKPETTILEGKYWKRRAEAVIAEYKKWRMFHIMRLFGKGDALAQDTISDMDTVESFSQCSDLAGNMLTDEDYLNFMSDTLFSTISSHQPFAFPDPREIARGANLADFIQPSLGPLQPNLDDFMDTLEPLHDIFSVSRLPPVPEEPPAPDMFRADFQQPYHDMTAQMTVHGNSNPQLMSGMSEQVVKHEQMQMLESARLYEPPYAPPYDDQYKRAPFKALPHQEPYGKGLPQDYGKFSAGPPAAMPPSATAPATVSLLQASTPPAPAAPPAAAPRRPYARDKPRPRAPYAPPYPPAAYPPADHYLSAPADRAFKMPSPPPRPAPAKDSFRSNSLPLGTQLNADWTLGPRAERSPGREVGALRLRSRSSSSSALGEARRPPPLTSVASDPALPQTRLMLAQLLSSQHSTARQAEEGGVSPARSPAAWAEGRSPSPPGSPGSPREPRRTHMHAEQKRRYNIKNGFDTLQALIPHLNNNPAAKVSKAAMLQKGAEYIKQLKAERNQIKQDMENLRQQIECLNNSISNCHALLPATGAPVSRARAGRLREMFARHVADRTLHNWKYWLFSVVAAALVDSFSACVSCGSGADLVRTTLLWAEQHCSLVEMRPAVLNSLRVLCTSTEILTAPDRLPEEARAAAAAAAVKTEPT